ncbi:MAG: hypothetical protein JSV66_09620 [Trueperaceae bacterium]|nr:MAG: hypothetical protein JSV66_09620 [Trueperaceae bacterium]
MKGHTRYDERTRDLLKVYSNGLASHPHFHHTRATPTISHRVHAVVTAVLRWARTCVRGLLMHELLPRSRRFIRSLSGQERAPISD